MNPALGWILLALTNVSDLYLYLYQHKFNTFILYIIIIYKHLINIAFRSIITKYCEYNNSLTHSITNMVRYIQKDYLSIHTKCKENIKT